MVWISDRLQTQLDLKMLHCFSLKTAQNKSIGCLKQARTGKKARPFREDRGKLLTSARKGISKSAGRIKQQSKIEM
jgi:hypothetical protein